MQNLNVINVETGFWITAKWVYVLAFVVYLIFAVIVWRQINLMGKTLNGTMEGFFRILGIVLVLIALGGLLLSLAVL